MACASEYVPNIIEVFEDRFQIMIVLEYIAGTNLTKIVDSLVGEEKCVKRIFLTFCQGLSYLHSLGVVHRDIKLDNLMLNVIETKSLEAKFIDFGLSIVLLN
jgi:serine/threonine protein kinase